MAGLWRGRFSGENVNKPDFERFEPVWEAGGREFIAVASSQGLCGVVLGASTGGGDAPQFLSICHVLEFEPIYREEAKGRMSTGGGKHIRVGINDTDPIGRSRTRMAEGFVRYQ